MKNPINTRTISIDALRSNFGTIKRVLMMSMAGKLRGTDLDREEVWKEVAKKSSHKKPVTL